jgi:hypothetical protein
MLVSTTIDDDTKQINSSVGAILARSRLQEGVETLFRRYWQC